MRAFATLALALAVSLLPSLVSAQIVVTAGKITHTVEAATAIATLPSAWANPKYGKSTLPKPAIAGNVWYVIRGRSVNGDTLVRSLNSGSFWIELNGQKLTPKAATSFQPDDTSIMRSVQVPPGGTQAWVAFFQVPTGSTGAQLMLTDFVGGTRKTVAGTLLPPATPGAAPAPARGAAAAPAPPARAPAATPARAGSITAQSVVGTWKLDEPRSKAAADGNGALLMRTLNIKADGTFEALYDTKGTWRIQGGQMIVTYACCPGQPAAVAFDGGHLKFPAPSNVKKFCYMVR